MKILYGINLIVLGVLFCLMYTNLLVVPSWFKTGSTAVLVVFGVAVIGNGIQKYFFFKR